MKRLGAAFLLQIRSPIFVIGLLVLGTLGTMVAILGTIMPFMGVAERHVLWFLGAMIAVGWLPALIAFQLRRHLLIGAIRLVPVRGYVGAAVILNALLAGPALAVGVIVFHADPLIATATVILWVFLMARVGWSNGGNPMLLVLIALVNLPGALPWYRECLKGGHPWNRLGLMAAGAGIAMVVVRCFLIEAQDDRDVGRIRYFQEGWRLGAIRWRRPRVPQVIPPLSHRFRDWGRHLSHGWRAERVHPVLLGTMVVLLGVLLMWATRERLVSGGTMFPLWIVGGSWVLGQSVVEQAPLVWADAVRPITRPRFAQLVLWVIGRALTRAWLAVWVGAVLVTALMGEAGSVRDIVAWALIGAALLPAHVALVGWLMSLRNHPRLQWLCVLLPCAVLWPIALRPEILTESPLRCGLVCVGVGIIGVALVGAVYRRWCVMEIT